MCLDGLQGFDFFIRFEFILVLISAYYLLKEILVSNLMFKSRIPRTFQLFMVLLIVIVVINIFRSPPSNIKGFLRFLGGKFYVAAWLPLLFFYIGSKLEYWNQILAFALKYQKFILLGLPFIVFVVAINFNGSGPLVMIPLLFPILILNRDVLDKVTNRLITVSMIIYLISVYLIGSRGYTLHALAYIPLLYYITVFKKSVNRKVNMLKLNAIFLVVSLGGYAIFNFEFSESLGGVFQTNVEKFEAGNFENSRKQYVYPDFFADMKTNNDWIFGRGLNGSYYSFIFVGHMADLDETNSLGVKKGHRTEIESGYLFTIMKIGLLGLILKLILAFSAIYFGLFKSNNFFVKSCALIVFEWLIFMYPVGLPEFNLGYILFWLCIGTCLSRETRLASSSKLFMNNLIDIRNRNNSFFNIRKF